MNSQKKITQIHNSRHFYKLWNFEDQIWHRFREQRHGPPPVFSMAPRCGLQRLHLRSSPKSWYHGDMTLVGGFYGGLMGINGGLMALNGISWWFNGILWWFNRIYIMGISMDNWLVVYLPLWKNIWKSVGVTICHTMPNIWKSKKCSKPPTSDIIFMGIAWMSGIPSGKRTYITNWKDPPFCSWVNQLFLWPFSIANCKRLPEGISW